jgi:small basic protein (TIGR04137 family)
MSIHRSLVAANVLVRHRNVLRRGERLARLEEDGRWQEGGDIFGLPKVRNIKIVVKKKKKEKVEELTAEGVPAEGAAPAAAEPGKAAAPAAKGAKAAAAKDAPKAAAKPGAAKPAAKDAKPAKGGDKAK